MTLSYLQSVLWFVSGLGLFLFGMYHLEQSMRALSSDSFRRVLRKTTGNRITALFGGTVITMIVQSSSMVGLMTMALVGAGVIPLANGVGLVLGANLGTTATGWIVTTLGFKLKLAEFAVPLMGGGALIFVLVNPRQRWRAWGSFMLGLGLLLFGLDGMKTSMDGVAESLDVARLSGYSNWVYLLVGVVFSAIVQSSSATMMVTLSALSVGMIDLGSAAALVIGADLGTTSTMALGGIKGSAVKKQLALSHILINVVTAIQAFALLPLYLGLVKSVFGEHQPLYSLVAFHSLFNLVGILLLVPFVKTLSVFLQRWFQDAEQEIRTYVNNVPSNQVEEALLAIAKEVDCVVAKSCVLGLRSLKVDVVSLSLPQKQRASLMQAFHKDKQFIDCYAETKKLEGEILEYAGLVQTQELLKPQVEKLHGILQGARHAVYSAKSMKDVRENLAQLRHSDCTQLQQFYQNQRDNQKHMLTSLCHLWRGDLDGATLREQLIQLIQQNRFFHQSVEQGLFATGLHSGASEEETSTLLNVNRELRASLENLAKAVFFLNFNEDPGSV